MPIVRRAWSPCLKHRVRLRSGSGLAGRLEEVLDEFAAMAKGTRDSKRAGIGFGTGFPLLSVVVLPDATRPLPKATTAAVNGKTLLCGPPSDLREDIDNALHEPSLQLGIWGEEQSGHQEPAAGQ